MRRRRGLLIVAMVAVLVVFAVGVVQLIVYRLQTGPSYPKFSSLRADPVGTRALAESLDRVGGLTVSRHYDPLPRDLPAPQRTTLMYLGVDPTARSWEDPNHIRTRLQEFVEGGGRLVVALTWTREQLFATKDGVDAVLVEEESDSNEVTLGGLLGFLPWLPGDPPVFTPYRTPYRMGAELTEVGQRRLSAAGPVRMFPGHSVVNEPQDEWEALALDDMSSPVIIRRRLGEGEIIITGGTWWLGNLSLSKHPPSAAIAALVAGRPRVVFDEAHLGIYETPGLARMTWKAGLLPAAGVLAVVALLFVWRNAARLAPARRMPRSLQGGRVLGKDTNEGLVNLLQRSVPKDRLLRTCLAEWEKTVPAGRGDLQAKADKLRTAAAPYLNDSTRRGIIEGYRTLRRIASERT